MIGESKIKLNYSPLNPTEGRPHSTQREAPPPIAHSTTQQLNHSTRTYGAN